MKKSTLLTAMGLFLCSTFVLKAQESKTYPWTFGVKAGVNLSNSSVDESSSRIGFNGGATVDYDLGKNFFLSSGLEFSQKNVKATNHFKDFSMPTYYGQTAEEASKFTGKVESSLNLMYLQLPLTIGYRLPVSEDVNISLRAGGYLAYGIHGSIRSTARGTMTTTEGVETPIDNTIKYNDYDASGFERFDWGLIGGIGAEYKRFSLNLSYELGLRDLDNSGLYSTPNAGANYIDKDSNWKNRNATLTVGYKF